MRCRSYDEFNISKFLNLKFTNTQSYMWPKIGLSFERFKIQRVK